MGLHRDGSRWGLPPDIVDQRRRVFWECHAAEVLQVSSFSARSASLTGSGCLLLATVRFACFFMGHTDKDIETVFKQIR
jgi:hypothetical protein